MHRTNRVALRNKWVWGPQGGFIYRYPPKLWNPAKLCTFHSICPLMTILFFLVLCIEKMNLCTTKSLNSNDYFNLSSLSFVFIEWQLLQRKALNSNDYFKFLLLFVHRNSKVALRNKWVLGYPVGINIQIPSKIMPFHSICPRMFKKWNCYNEKFEL